MELLAKKNESDCILGDRLAAKGTYREFGANHQKQKKRRPRVGTLTCVRVRTHSIAISSSSAHGMASVHCEALPHSAVVYDEDQVLVSARACASTCGYCPFVHVCLCGVQVYPEFIVKYERVEASSKDIWV